MRTLPCHPASLHVWKEVSRSKLKNNGFFVRRVCDKCGTEIQVTTKPHSHRRLTAKPKWPRPKKPKPQS